MKKGFTLIETLVAIAILGLAIAGPLYSASRALIAAQNSKNYLTASALAQEGIEYTRRLRDNRYLENKANTTTSAAWTAFANDISDCASNDCAFEVWTIETVPLARCLTSPCQPLYINANHRFVQQNTGTPSIFTRTIRSATVAGSSDARKITAQVKWNFRGQPYDVTISDTLMPWQPSLAPL